MPREPEPSLNERQFILAALGDNLRLDGRGFDDAREVEIEFGDAFGSVDVRMGKTRYVPHYPFYFPPALVYQPSNSIRAYTALTYSTPFTPRS